MSALQKADVLELLFTETHNHMGTQLNPCIYMFQFDKLVDKIDKIYEDESTDTK